MVMFPCVDFQLTRCCCSAAATHRPPPPLVGFTFLQRSRILHHVNRHDEGARKQIVSDAAHVPHRACATAR